MSRRNLILLAVVFVALLNTLVAAPVRAQEPQAIKYGDSVEAQLTKTSYEVFYTFTGKQGDVAIAQMFPIKDNNGDYFTSFALQIFDSNNKKIADSTDVLIFFDDSAKALGAELPADGSYTLVATRLNGKDGSGVGHFGLTLDRAKMLTLGQTVKGSATQIDAGRYHAFYALDSRDAFTVKYKRVGEGFSPLVMVSHLQTGHLTSDAIMGGGRLSVGTLNVDGSRDVIIVSVSDSDLSTFYKEKAGLDYEITFDEGVGGLQKQ